MAGGSSLLGWMIFGTSVGCTVGLTTGFWVWVLVRLGGGGGGGGAAEAAKVTVSGGGCTSSTWMKE